MRCAVEMSHMSNRKLPIHRIMIQSLVHRSGWIDYFNIDFY